MNEMPQFENNNEQENLQENEPDIYNETQNKIFTEINNEKNSHEAVSRIYKSIEPLFKYIDKEILPEEKIEGIKNSLLECGKIEDKEELAKAIVEVIKPILDIKKNNPAKYEEYMAKLMNEHGGFTEINRLVSYGKSGNIIHFHAPDGKYVNNKFSLYRQGMRDLAKIVAADPEVIEITTTSYVVAEHPEIFTMMGFNVREITPEERARFFPDATELIKRAEISREDFLKKFLKDKNNNE